MIPRRGNRIRSASRPGYGLAFWMIMLPWMGTTAATHAGQQPAESTAIVHRSSIDDAQLTATLDRDRVELWEQATLTLVLRAPEGTIVEWPEISGSIGELSIVPIEPGTQRYREGVIESERAWRISAFLPGHFEIPAVEASVTGDDGRTRTLRAGPFVVVALSSLDDEDPAIASPLPDGMPTFEPAPLREAPPLGEPDEFPLVPISIFATGALAIGISAWVAAFVANRRQRPDVLIDPLDMLEHSIVSGDPARALADSDGALRGELAALLGRDANTPLSTLIDLAESREGAPESRRASDAQVSGSMELRRDLIGIAWAVVRVRYAPSCGDDGLALSRAALAVVRRARAARDVSAGALPPSAEGAS